MISPDLSEFRGIFLDEARDQLAVLESFVVGGQEHGLDEAFRAAHALKGAAATMGYEALAEAAHSLESQLALIRQGSAPEGRLRVDFDELRNALNAVAHTSHELTLSFDVSPECLMPSVRALLIQNELGGLGNVLSTHPDPDHVATHFKVVMTTTRSHEEILEVARKFPEVRLNEASDAPQGLLIEKRSTARVSIERLDRALNLASELMIERTRLTQSLSKLPDTPEFACLRESSDRIWKLAGDLQDVAMRARLVPVESVLRRLPKLAQDLAVQLNKTVEVDISGGDTEVDRSVLDVLGDPLIHMMRNALDHGIETASVRLERGKPGTGKLSISAHQGDGAVEILVSDDGNGIDPDNLRQAAVTKNILDPERATSLSDQEAIELIFASGFTTASGVSGVSGRGVGMDIVRSNIEKVGGRIEVESQIRFGTRFRLTMPLSLSVLRCLLVRSGGVLWAIPTTHILKTCRAPEATTSLAHALGLARSPGKFGFTVGAAGSEPRTFSVEELVSEEEFVVKPISRLAGGVKAISGASILADGRVVLILDPMKL